MKGFFVGFPLSEDFRKMNFEAMNCVFFHICTKKTIAKTNNIPKKQHERHLTHVYLNPV